MAWRGSEQSLMGAFRLAAICMLSGAGSVLMPTPASTQGDRGQAMGLPLLGYIFEVAGHCARHGASGEVERMRELADAQPDARQLLLRRLRRGLRSPRSAKWCEAEMRRIR